MFPSHPCVCCLPLTLPLPPSSTEPMPPFTSLPCLTTFLTLASWPLPLPCLHLYYSNPPLWDWLTPLLAPPSLPLSSPIPVVLPPRPTWPTAAPMVVSRVRPRGLEGVEDSFRRPGPAWTAVWAAYTIVFIPLSSGLYSSKALHFFLWVSKTTGEVSRDDGRGCKTATLQFPSQDLKALIFSSRSFV